MTNAPSSLTWVGQRVADRYEIQRQLAKGTMGRVFLAIQHPLGRRVAVKVLETHEGLDEAGNYEERFVKEAAALARLSHPNTVRIYDYGSWKGRLFLVMEFIDGPTLSAILRQEGRLSPERALRLARQIAGSLAEAHDEGVVHRDLKPSNVLVSRQGARGEVAKVVDFGLVKDIIPDEELTGVGLLLGTPRYMAPEQIRGADVDGRVDIYALGVFLYRAITGRVPFDQKPTTALLHAHLNADPPSFEMAAPGLAVPPAIEWTVRTCLAKEPEDRFQDAWALMTALDACRVVVRDEAWRNATFRLEGGQVVTPFALESPSEGSGSLSALSHTNPADELDEDEGPSVTQQIIREAALPAALALLVLLFGGAVVVGLVGLLVVYGPPSLAGAEDPPAPAPPTPIGGQTEPDSPPKAVHTGPESPLAPPEPEPDPEVRSPDPPSSPAAGTADAEPPPDPRPDPGANSDPSPPPDPRAPSVPNAVGDSLQDEPVAPSPDEGAAEGTAEPPDVQDASPGSPGPAPTDDEPEPDRTDDLDFPSRPTSDLKNPFEAP